MTRNAHRPQCHEGDGDEELSVGHVGIIGHLAWSEAERTRQPRILRPIDEFRCAPLRHIRRDEFGQQVKQLHPHRAILVEWIGELVWSAQHVDEDRPVVQCVRGDVHPAVAALPHSAGRWPEVGAAIGNSARRIELVDSQLLPRRRLVHRQIDGDATGVIAPGQQRCLHQIGRTYPSKVEHVRSGHRHRRALHRSCHRHQPATGEGRERC